MIKATIKKDGVDKDLFLWLQARESGKDKLVVTVSVNESEALCKSRMEIITEKYWAKEAGITSEYVFDGSVKEAIVNPLTKVIDNLFVGSGNFRTLYHNLVLDKINSIKSIIKAEVIL